MSTKKRPEKRHYVEHKAKARGYVYDCWGCRKTTPSVFELKGAWVDLAVYDYDGADMWLCQSCYDDIGSGMSKKADEWVKERAEERSKSDCYEGLAVFPLLNGL